MRLPKLRGGEAGSFSVELAFLALPLTLLLLIVVLGGRVVESQAAVNGAARDAARAASIARYPGTGDLGATTLADQAATGDLKGYCAGGDLKVTVGPFPDKAAQLGQNVTVTVRCDINTSIFGLLGLGATHQITASAVAPLDPFMCRGTDC